MSGHSKWATIKRKKGAIDAARGNIGGDEHAHAQFFESTHDFVALGLQAAEEPGARVREAFVVQVDWVLCDQHHAHAEGTSLFHHRQQRTLGRRLGRGWEEAEDLVERLRLAGIPDARPAND